MTVPSVVIVQPDGADNPGLLGEVLARRNRPTVVLGPGDDPPPPDAVRGVAVLGARTSQPAPAPALTEWLDACRAGGVPILAMSEGCQLLVGATAAPGDAGMVQVDFMPDSKDDPVFGDVPAGSVWPVTGPPLPELEDTTVELLVDAAGEPVAVRGAEPVYLTRLAPYRSAADLAELLPQDAETIVAAARFLDALAVTLVGRWVDAVVGRTEEEAPWGRKGPQPVPGPGLSLNPLPAGS